MQGREIPLEDLRWLRTLAERLVHDPNAADDALQETLVTALERRPRNEHSLRGWLFAIMRNVLRQEWRREGRHRRLAQHLPPRPAAPSAAELVEDVALHGRLIEHVNALDEPYRKVIVMRFLHERTPREIALDLGLTTKAVHTRIERALAKLRERMSPDRRSWLLFLRPWKRTSSGALQTALQLSVLLLGGVGLSWGAIARWRAAEPDSHAIRSEEPPAASVAGTSALEGPPARRLPREVQPIREARAPGPVAELVTGVVRALDGTSVPGAELGFERQELQPWGETYALDPAVKVRADARGRFALPLPREPGRLTLTGGSMASVNRPHLDGTLPPEPLVLVVGLRRAYAGRVIDHAGNAIEDASVEVLRGDEYLQLADVGGEPVNLVMPLAEERTDARGGFRLAAVGFVPGAELVVRRSGFEVGRFALPLLSRDGLELVLEPVAATVRTLRGTVLDLSGAPAAGAEVSAGGASVRTGRDGCFVLAFRPGEEGGVLRAVRPGSLPAEEPIAALLERADAREGVLLRLGPPPLSIAGRVHGPDGLPVAGASIWTPALTPFGDSLHGAGRDWFLWRVPVEVILSEQFRNEDRGLVAVADEHGRFRIEGLLRRSYPLFALDPRTLDACGPIDVQAGEPLVRLHLSHGARGPRSGQLVSTEGQPLAGVSVVPGVAFPMPGSSPAARAEWTTNLAGFAAVTDADGFFWLPDLPVSGVCLQLHGPELLQTVTIFPDATVSPTSIRVPRGARFRLRLPDPDMADEYELLDEQGRAQPLFLEAAGRAVGVPRMAVASGCSGVALAAEGEHVVVLYSCGVEVWRTRVTLPAGGPVEIAL